MATLPDAFQLDHSLQKLAWHRGAFVLTRNKAQRVNILVLRVLTVLVFLLNNTGAFLLKAIVKHPIVLVQLFRQHFYCFCAVVQYPLLLRTRLSTLYKLWDYFCY